MSDILTLYNELLRILKTYQTFILHFYILFLFVITNCFAKKLNYKTIIMNQNISQSEDKVTLIVMLII